MARNSEWRMGVHRPGTRLDHRESGPSETVSKSVFSGSEALVNIGLPMGGQGKGGGIRGQRMASE